MKKILITIDNEGRIETHAEGLAFESELIVILQVTIASIEQKMIENAKKNIRLVRPVITSPIVGGK